MRLLYVAPVGVAVLLVGAGMCSRETPGVSIASPRDGAHVTSPVAIDMRAHGIAIEPAGSIHENAGHFHVIVDRDCVKAGLPIETTRPGYWHFGAGQRTAELDLAPGRHELCLEVGDGAHVALGRTDHITITVEP